MTLVIPLLLIAILTAVATRNTRFFPVAMIAVLLFGATYLFGNAFIRGVQVSSRSQLNAVGNLWQCQADKDQDGQPDYQINGMRDTRCDHLMLKAYLDTHPAQERQYIFESGQVGVSYAYTFNNVRPKADGFAGDKLAILYPQGPCAQIVIHAADPAVSVKLTHRSPDRSTTWYQLEHAQHQLVATNVQVWLQEIDRQYCS